MGAMTDLFSRVRGTQAARPSLPIALAALVAALVGLLGCIAVALAAWLSDPRGGLADALRAGADAWLLAHGGGLRVGAAHVTVVPLGLAAFLALVVWRAARWAGRRTPPAGYRAVGVGAMTFATGYAAIATLTAVLSGTDQVSAAPLRVLVGALVFGLVVATAGLAGVAGLRGPALAAWPEELRAAVRGGAAVVATLVGAGAVLVTAALVTGFGQAATAADALQAGVVGGAVLTVLGVLFLPNASLLAMSYLIGPGFAFGSGTLVAPSGVSLGTVPGLPLLAALPEDGATPAWQVALVAAPALAGAVGATVALHAYPVSGLSWGGLLLRGARRGGLAGLLGGASAGLLTALGGGAIGPGRMVEVGALVWQCSVVAAVGGGAATGVVLAWRARRRSASG
jgi:hypothetical protein